MCKKTNNKRLTGIGTRVQSGSERARRVDLFSEAKGKRRYGVATALMSWMMKPAWGIVINEDNRIKEPEPGFSGQFPLAIADQSGNTEKTATSAGTRL